MDFDKTEQHDAWIEIAAEPPEPCGRTTSDGDLND